MSIIKKITILLGIFFISGVAQVSAQEIKKIGKYKDWEAMVVMDAVSYTHLTLPTKLAV